MSSDNNHPDRCRCDSCRFDRLSREHDETRRRLGDLRDQVSMVEGDLIGRLMRRLESLEADTTSVRPIEDAELDSAQFDKEVDETGGVTVFYPVTSPTLTDRLAEALSNLAGCADYLPPERQWMIKQANATLNAARSAPAAQPPAVPADVMAAADFLLNDDVGSDLDGLTFVNQSIEHGKTLARYVRDSVSGAVAAGGGAPAAQPPTRKLNRAAFREWVKELKASQARAAAERLTRMCKGEIEPYDYVSDAKLVNEAVIAWTEELIEPTPPASPPAGEWTRDVPTKPGWYWWKPKSASAIPQQVYRSHDSDLHVAGFPVGELSGGEWSTTPLQPPVCPDCNGTGKVPDSSGWCNCGCKRKVASPPAEEILKQAANQIEWYRSLCQCLECGSLCQNCNDSTDIIDALRSVASLPPPGEPGVMCERTIKAAIDKICESAPYRIMRVDFCRQVTEAVRSLIGQPLPAGEGKP